MFETIVLSTGQHREMLTPMLNCFDIAPHIDMVAMRPGQPLSALVGRLVRDVGVNLRRVQPDLVIVHGDTATAYAAALAAFYEHLPIVHIEAGLRSDNLNSPFPEEAHRRFISTVSWLHMCSTERNRSRLIRENINDANIFVTGNTVIDSLHWAREQPNRNKFPKTRSFRVLVTVHRRENHGPRLQQIVSVINRLVKCPSIEVAVAIHHNPAVRDVLSGSLLSVPNLSTFEPLAYPDFIGLLESSDVVLTDSGGLQEEAASLGKLVLVLNSATERPEAVAMGTTRIVGTEAPDVYRATLESLAKASKGDDRLERPAIFGDGFAGKRIIDILVSRLNF